MNRVLNHEAHELTRIGRRLSNHGHGGGQNFEGWMLDSMAEARVFIEPILNSCSIFNLPVSAFCRAMAAEFSGFFEETNLFFHGSGTHVHFFCKGFCG
jgi:hypothetical protein